MFGTQEAVVGNKRPDAHVETADGLVAIDAKFPLEAYERAVNADDPEVRARHEQEFARRVEDQTDKIATAYVRPDEGTAEFAFAFIPSEASTTTSSPRSTTCCASTRPRACRSSRR